MLIHDYYSYTKEEMLEKGGKIPFTVYPENADIFKAMADEMADEIIKHNEEGKTTVFIVPVGPVGQYPYFVERVNAENISLQNVWFINMDEYLDENKQYVAEDYPLSFRGFMNRVVYSQIKPELVMPKEQRVFPDPENVEYIPNLIEKLGGVDMCFGGIGINGHVAFNEADASTTGEEFLSRKTRVLPISRETRAANAIGDFNGNLEDFPRYCVTIGIYEIAHAKKIRLGCFRNWHRAVVRRTIFGESTPDFPVSLLQNHPDIQLRFSEFVAAVSD